MHKQSLLFASATRLSWQSLT